MLQPQTWEITSDGDSSQQTTRALKYAMLFLILTFMTFFFAEIMANQKIHPIQYLMVGCGLLVFYLLLLSISEHIAFGYAYLIAATGVILQISLYCCSILKTRKFALQVGALLSFYLPKVSCSGCKITQF